MKWLAYLFAFYILLLSGIPCSADDDCCVEARGYATPSKSDPDHRPATACSPLFACCSAHGITVPETIGISHIAAPSVLIQHHFYIQTSISDFSRAIWQPPQLAS